MRKIVSIALAFALFSSPMLSADPKVVGEAAANSSRDASNNWQAWAFAGGAVILATVGLVIISMNKGESPKNH